MASALGASKYAKIDILKTISKSTKRGTRTSTKSHDIKGKVTNLDIMKVYILLLPLLFWCM